ncbi:MAG: glycosyltransferase family 2 protein [Chloroflexi bacterium]|nr:glycosyltransferase family 2 protein [Chloroflexota bacterium]
MRRKVEENLKWRTNVTKPRFSIVAPCFNEEKVLPELHRRICQVMEQTGETWELVLVNDGSHDRTADVMRELHAQDARVKVIDFARNFSHQLAVTAGLDYARGDAVIIIDADLQDPPELILQMIQKWRQGYEVVYAVRTKRRGESWFKEFTAKLFYRIIYRITDVKIPLDTGDFRLMDRKVVDAIKQLRERHRFIRGMTSWVGFRQTGVEYERQERFAGETHYPFKKMLKFAIDAITSFSYAPLQVATYLGFLIAGVSAIAGVFVIYARLFLSDHPFFGQATTLVAVLFLGGVQLITLGIIGEYLGRIYDEVKGRPLYIAREVLGFDDASEKSR